ncbi:MAG: hypothetical protein IH789_09260 [Acidobacteria bacterium]|nr:hypothetical protein [Acidobacteriota bacterium]MCH8947797.1 hypothetical protein [Acidobacteriota bacterium]
MSVAVLLATVPQVAPPEVSPALLQAVEEAYQQQQQEEPQILPPAQVDLKLVGKKVVIYCWDGRVYKGKLLDLASDHLSVRTRRRGVQELSLIEVTTVEQQESRARRAWRALKITGIVVGVGGLVWLIGTSRD